MSVEEIAKNKIVEGIINNIAQSGDRRLGFLDDLAQDIYLVLLSDKDFVESMEDEQQRYYITRIVLNQIQSKNSRYYYNYKKQYERVIPIDDVKYKIDDERYNKDT